MDIINIEFEESLTIKLNGEKVNLTVFRTDEHGNVKFGVNAPRSMSVDREEIAEQKRNSKM